MDFQEYDELQKLYENYLKALKKYEEKQNKFKPFDRVYVYAYRKQAKRAHGELATIAEICDDLCLVIFDRNDIEATMPCKRLGVDENRALWIDYKNLYKFI